MRCSSPGYAWESRATNPSGKRSLVFHPSQGLPGTGREVPCTKCTCCKINASRDWAIRLFHECQLHPVASVATLTFDDAHVPDSIADIRRHAKALKKRLIRRDVNPRSHWLCEYGGRFDRPHAHVIFFHSDFRQGYCESMSGGQYVSEFLADTWANGHCLLDSVSPQACRYTAGHNQGKILAAEREDGSPTFFNIPATRPAIGMRFAREFSSDLLSVKGSVIGRNVSACPKAYRKNEPDLFEPISAAYEQFAIDTAAGESDDYRVVARDAREREYQASYSLYTAREARAWHKRQH